jgi:hypothetical protein
MPERYTAQQIAFAGAAWTMRAEEERRSAAVFSDLLSLIADAEASLVVVHEVHAMVGDELFHAALCAERASALGAPRPASAPLPRKAALPLAPEERRSRALEIVLVEGAMGETISSALFAAGRRAAEEAAARAALTRILKDEAMHARRFWRLLDALRGPGDEGRLHAVATRALGLIERTQIVPVLKRLERSAPFDPAWAALGVLPPEARVEAFYGAIERRVVPELDARGLHGTRAWEARYRRGCALE